MYKPTCGYMFDKLSSKINSVHLREMVAEIKGNTRITTLRERMTKYCSFWCILLLNKDDFGLNDPRTFPQGWKKNAALGGCLKHCFQFRCHSILWSLIKKMRLIIIPFTNTIRNVSYKSATINHIIPCEGIWCYLGLARINAWIN